MISQDTIIGVVLIFFGVSLTIWEIKTFSRREQVFLGYDVGGLVFGLGCIIWGVTLLV